MTKIIAPVIQRKDKDFPEFLNFKQLRKEGLEHIGRFAGDIWTDHNTHDPGVTILEALIYAILDLGYRTQLPIEDLLAAPKGETNKQYFSAAEILSNNPTTILDYRKMLIDLPGVRNAWLEIADSELTLALNANQSELICVDSNTSPINPVPLNGLYKVYLQLDRSSLDCEDDTIAQATINQILTRVRERLHAHRNLCEDYTKICILCEEKMQVCIDVNLHEDVDSEMVYVNIFDAINQFFTPPVHFYTLQQMLQKGKAIEEIFEGRPYGLDSYGFIDTDELGSIRRKKEIHLSDLYQIIMQIEGVKNIRDLGIKGNVGSNSANCKEWVYQLAEDHVPVLCLDQSKLRLMRDGIVISVDQKRIDKLWKQRLGQQTKPEYLNPDLLDQTAPKGRYRKDLGDYYSIQNDLPAVYGIREGGIPEDSSDLRKAQALQLKGYLLFFDNLLASYLAQLANMKDMFAMQPESERSPEVQHTYFVQQLNAVPDVHKLLRFFPNEADTTIGSIVAYPIERSKWDVIQNLVDDDPNLVRTIPTHIYSDAAERAVAVAQFSREFEQNEYSIEVYGKDATYFFILSTSYDEAVFVSKLDYTSEAAAKAAARDISFMASLVQNYRDYNSPSSTTYTFELINTPISYLDVLQDMVESPAEYTQRRSTFLDHLLARFNECFNDFSLQLFQQEGNVLEAKSQFLSRYDKISRDRGRAFNYQESYWNTDNISGIEQQVAGRLGIDAWQKQRLCNFEVVRYGAQFQYELVDHQGVRMMATDRIYDSEEEALHDIALAKSTLSNAPAFEKVDDPSKGYFSYKMDYPNGTLYAKESFESANSRDQRLAYLEAVYQKNPVEDRIKIVEYIHHLELTDVNQKVVRQSTKEYKNEDTALKASASFAKAINRQTKIGDAPEKLTLTVLSNGEQWLDQNEFEECFRLEQEQYRWQILGDKQTILLSSAEAYPSQKAASDALQITIESYDGNWSWKEVEQFSSLQWQLVDGKGKSIAVASSNDANLRVQVPIFFQQEKEKSTINKVKSAYSWQVLDEQKKVLLSSVLWSENKRTAERTWSSFSNQKLSVEKIRTKTKVVLKDSRGRLLAQSKNLSKKEANAYLEQINARIQTKSNIKFTKENTAFGFQIKAKDNNVLLNSYHYYPSTEAAWQAIDEVKAVIGRKKSYFLTGDEVNLNFGFSIKNEEDHFLATSPAELASEKEREELIKTVQKQLKQYQNPFAFRTEQHFIVQINTQDFFRSTNAYVEEEQAKADYQQLIQVVAEEGSELLKQQPISIIAKEKLIAQSILEDSAEEKKLLAAFCQKINDNSYQIQTSSAPSQWKYEYCWKDETASFKRLFLSNEKYPSPEAATKAYTTFYENIDDVNVKVKTTADKKYRLDLYQGNEKTAFASTDEEYSKKADAVNKKEEVETAFAYVAAANQPALLDAPTHAVDQTPTSRRGDYAYRVVDKGLPMAFAPCVCVDDKIELTDEILKQLQALLSNLPYCDFCMAGNNIRQVGLKYQYVFRNKDNSQLIYFVSTQLYDTVLEAQAAFEAHFFEIVELASDPANYGTTINIGQPLDISDEACQDNGPLVYIPDEMVRLYHSRPETWLICFCSYPIRRCEKVVSADECKGINDIEYCYYFQLLLLYGRNKSRDIHSIHYVDISGNETIQKKIAWKSSTCYSTSEEAWNAFQLFECVVKQTQSFHLYYDDESVLQRQAESCCDPTVEVEDRCCYYLAISEVLLESECRYTTENGAWGKPAPIAKIYYTSANGECLPHKFTNLNTACFRHQTICKCVFGNISDPSTSNDFNGFRFEFDNGECIIKSEQIYASETEAIEASASFSQMVSTLKCRVFQEEDCAYYIGLFEEDCHPHPCELDCWEDAQQKRGLEALMEVSCKEETYYQITDPQQEKPYSFLAVNEHYRIARHPFLYNTEQEIAITKRYLNRICKKSQTSTEIIYEEIEITSTSKEYWLHFSNANSKTSLQLQTENIPHTTAEKQQLYVVNYAAHPEFFHMDESTLYLLNQPYSNIVNIDTAKIAVEDISNLTEEQKQKRIQEINQLAWYYPYRLKQNGQIKFQWYCASFPSNLPSDDEVCKPCETPSDTDPSPNGAVIWESFQCFDNLIEAKCYFDLFCILLQDAANCQPLETDCTTYGLMLVNPSGVVAYHPQWYDKLSSVEAAIERTKAITQRQGMHLLEHILLRPKPENSDKKCFLPIEPDRECVLCCPPIEEDPCSQSDRSTTVNVSGTDTEVVGTATVVLSDEKSPCEEDSICEDYIPGADPYSFMATIVLPAWTKTSSTLEGREGIQKIIRTHLPAHVALTIKWLSPKEMCLFETCYHQWLLWMRCERVCYPSYDPCSLMDCLMELNSCPLSEEKPTNDFCGKRRKLILFDAANFMMNAMFTRNADSLYSFSSINASNLLAINGNSAYFNTDSTIPTNTKPLLELVEPIAEKETAISTPMPEEDTVPLEVDDRTIQRILAQRTQTNKEALAAITNQNMLKSDYYERVEFFVNYSDGSMGAYQQMMAQIIEDNAQSDRKTGLKYYQKILAIATQHVLDRLVAKNQLELTSKEELTTILKSLKTAQVNVSKIGTNWNSDQLKDIWQASVVDQYVDLLNTI